MGIFQKIVIADSLSHYVDLVYEIPQDFHGFALVLAALLFAIQTYCDFSGYSDIAVGSAKLMGINLMTNFKSPYFSQSIAELWKRWHISLSTWFRDYVYIPLGGNRAGKFRHAFNVIVTFLLSGLWHGADWTFVVWGGMNSAALLAEQAVIPKQRQKSTGALKWIRFLLVTTFFSFTLIFGRAASFDDAFYVITHMFTGIGSPVNYLHHGFSYIGMTKSSLGIMIFCILILAVYDYMSLEKDVIELISKKNTCVRWTIYILFILIIIFLSDKGVGTEFIYFQF